MIDVETHLGEALAYEDYLPISCSLPDGVVDSVRFNGLNEQNEEILQNVLVLERHPAEPGDDEIESSVAELAHMDFKINLMLDLMMQVFATQLNIPPKSAISLSSSQLHCCSDQSFEVGDGLFVDLFLSRRFPRPLTLYGRVSRTEARQGGDFSLEIDLDHISPFVQELMERFIFLKHRRKVASDRRVKNS